MHPSDQNRQPENTDIPTGDDMPYTEPAWLKPVKTAVKIMSLLIIIGIGLLFYGLATQIGGVSEKADQIANISMPDTSTLISMTGAADGGTIMAFQGAGGDITVIKLSADRESIQVMARLTPDAATDFVLN